MTEEKKIEKPAEAAAQTQDAPQAKPAEEKPKEAVKAKKEKPANCAGCNKSIRKKRWYYRNGKYYCSKRCWTTAAKKEKKTETGGEAKP